MPDIFKINPNFDINKSNVVLGVPGTGYQYIPSASLNTGNNHSFTMSNPIGSGLGIVNGKLFTNLLPSNHLMPPDPDIIFPVSGEFPTINAGERLVKTYNIGNVGIQKKVMVIFFNSAISSFDSIKNGYTDSKLINSYSPSGIVQLRINAVNKNKHVPYFNGSTNNGTEPTTSCMIVHKNYNYSARFSAPSSEYMSTGIGIDMYNNVVQNGYVGVFNYINMANTLFGWSSGVGTPIALYSGYKVQMEGAWLSESGTNTLLNFAYLNNGTITAPGSGVWMGVYLL